MVIDIIGPCNINLAYGKDDKSVLIHGLSLDTIYLMLRTKIKSTFTLRYSKVSISPLCIMIITCINAIANALKSSIKAL
jgi:hypothetical protein